MFLKMNIRLVNLPLFRWRSLWRQTPSLAALVHWVRGLAFYKKLMLERVGSLPRGRIKPTFSRCGNSRRLQSCCCICVVQLLVCVIIIFGCLPHVVYSLLLYMTLLPYTWGIHMCIPTCAADKWCVCIYTLWLPAFCPLFLHLLVNFWI